MYNGSTVVPKNRKFQGRVTDRHNGRSFLVTIEAKDANTARQILTSQHAPNRVDFVREEF